MLRVKNSSEPWDYSSLKQNEMNFISVETAQLLKENDILAVEFINKSFKNNLNGVILNEEQDMNMQLQVCAFFNAIRKLVFDKFRILIIAPDHLISTWCFHLSQHADLKIKLVTPDTCPQDFDEENHIALVLSFTNLKLADHLIEYDYFSVVIDNFDSIATKRVVRRLDGTIKIGLTQRNFYLEPDQKLQWTMLNWSNPGCVGKLANFYEIDNDNFANFRNNYRYWWFRLTWKFSESFKKPSESEKRQYEQTVQNWAKNNNDLPMETPIPKDCKKNNNKDQINPEIKPENIPEASQDLLPNRNQSATRKVYNSKTIKKRKRELVYNAVKKEEEPTEKCQKSSDIMSISNIQREEAKIEKVAENNTTTKLSSDNELNKSDVSSQETIIYENDDIGPSCSKLAIINETITNDNATKRTYEAESTNIDHDDENDIILSIIKSSPLKNNETCNENKKMALKTKAEQSDSVKLKSNQDTVEDSELWESKHDLIDSKVDESTENDTESYDFLESLFSNKPRDNFASQEVKSHESILVNETSGVDAVYSDSDDFLNSLVGGRGSKTSVNMHKSRDKYRDIDVEQVLKSVDEILNS